MSRNMRLLVVALIVVAGAGAANWFLMRKPAAPEPVNTGNPVIDAVAKLPDWYTGAWEADEYTSVLATEEAIPLAPEYAGKLAELRASVKSGGAMPGNPGCKPEGMPMFMEHRGPLLDIVFMRDRVVMNSGSAETRIIYTDGRKLPEEVPLDYFNGTGVGHWEGDTLVTEIVGIHADVEMLPGIENGGGMKVQERIHLIAPEKLEDEITLTAPSLTQPYTYKRTLTRHRDREVADYICLYSSQSDEQIVGQRSEADLIASTTKKPPVPRNGQPAANAAELKGGTWQSIATLPNWARMDGLWDYNNQGNENEYDTVIPLTPAFQKRLDYLRVVDKAGGDIPTNNYHCWPRGAVQGLKAAQTWFFLTFVPGRMQFTNFDAVSRRFYTDGRQHPENLELSFTGHTIAHWEGDELVADTVGLRPDVQMWNGMDSGGGLRIVERWKQIEPDKLEIRTTLTSPVSLTAPYEYSRTYSFSKGLEWMEDYCTQNNRDIDPSTGLQGFDLTPPP